MRIAGDPNQVVFLPADQECVAEHVHCRSSTCATTIEVREDMLAEASMTSPRHGREPQAPRTAQALLLFRRMQARLRRSAAEEVEELVFALVDEAVLPLREARHTKRRDAYSFAARRVVERTKLLLAVSFTEVVRLDDIARELGCSKFHLCRIFKQQTGMPIYRYLHQLRIDQALESFSSDDQDLSRLACDLGFSSHSHFDAVFRRIAGCPPSVARLLIRERKMRSSRAFGSPILEG